MLSRLWDFVKRNQRKGLVTCAVIGGGALITHYGIRKFQEYRQKELVDYLNNCRRDKHYNSTEETCQQTVLSLMNNLRSAILKSLDSDELTLLLKSKPPNKLDIWEELKLLSFTRVAVSVYASAMFVVLLRIQINIVGGLMFVNALNPNENTFPIMASSEMQEKFLECVRFFIQNGIDLLIENIKPSVQSIVGAIELKEKLKLANMESIFKQIRHSFETGTTYPLKNLASFAINNDETADLSPELKLILNETAEILNSHDSVNVLFETVNVGFSHLSDLLANNYMQLHKDCTQTFVNPHEIEVPLAKLIPVLNNLIFVLCSSQSKQLIETLLQCEKLKSFGANIYDAFSQPCKNESKITL